MFLRVPATLSLMAERSNAEVARYITHRMRELGLTRNALLDRTKISPKTLTALLDGTRKSQEDTEARIEPVLRWALGSIRDIRAGDEPTPLPDPPQETTAQSGHPSIYEDSAIEGFPHVFSRLNRQDQLQVIDYVDRLRQRQAQQSPSNVIDPRPKNWEQKPDPPGDLNAPGVAATRREKGSDGDDHDDDQDDD